MASLLLELLIICLLVAPSNYTPGVVAGGVLLAAFGVGSWLVAIRNKSRRAGSASIECGCMGGLRSLSSRMRHSVVEFSEQPPLWSVC